MEDCRKMAAKLGRTEQEELLRVLQDALARPPTVAEARAAREAALKAGASESTATAVADAVAAIVAQNSPAKDIFHIPREEGGPRRLEREFRYEEGEYFDYNSSSPVSLPQVRGALRNSRRERGGMPGGRPTSPPLARPKGRPRDGAAEGAGPYGARRRRHAAEDEEDDDDGGKWPVQREAPPGLPKHLQPTILGGGRSGRQQGSVADRAEAARARRLDPLVWTPEAAPIPEGRTVRHKKAPRPPRGKVHGSHRRPAPIRRIRMLQYEGDDGYLYEVRRLQFAI